MSIDHRAERLLRRKAARAKAVRVHREPANDIRVATSTNVDRWSIYTLLHKIQCPLRRVNG